MFFFSNNEQTEENTKKSTSSRHAKSQLRRSNKARLRRSLHAPGLWRADYKESSFKEEIVSQVLAKEKRFVYSKARKELEAEHKRSWKKARISIKMTGTTFFLANDVIRLSKWVLYWKNPLYF